MSKTIQIRVDDYLKKTADNLFASLGLDTSTAIRMFLAISIENGGIPFEVKLPNDSLKKAMNDVLNRRNLSEPYVNVNDAIQSMLED